MRRDQIQNRLTKGLTGLVLSGPPAASAIASGMGRDDEAEAANRCPSDIKGNECE